MAAANNPGWRSLVALLCVCALLLVAIPCGFRAAPHAMPNMNGSMPAAANCTPCCPGAPAALANTPCCAAHAATLEPSSTVQAALVELPLRRSAPVTLGYVAVTIATHSTAPPPLLQTNLRI